MAQAQLLPGNDVLRRWKDQGLSQSQMVAEIEKTTGQKVSRSAVAMALSRAGLVGEPKPRYKDTLPWRVKIVHTKHYAARMLRLLGKQMDGHELTAEESGRLSGWIDMLDREQAVVGYDPDSDDGFFYIDRSLKDHRGPIPIRRRRLIGM